MNMKTTNDVSLLNYDNIIKQYIIISDLHCGCQFGLCMPGNIKLDGGGFYTPSVLQQKVWSWWLEFWNDFVPRVTRGEPYGFIVNGDAMDGRHHNTTTQISQNLADQRRIAYDILKPVVERCNGKFYFIRGTEAHVGPAAENEEILAENLNSIPDSNGIHARWELWLRVGRNLAHIKHYIGTTSRMAYETSAPMAEYQAALAESARWDKVFPDWIVRSHRHRHSEIKVPTAHGDGICVVTPGWQLRTPFCYRLQGDITAQIGGILLRSGNEEHFTRHFVRGIERDDEECIPLSGRIEYV